MRYYPCSTLNLDNFCSKLSRYQKTIKNDQLLLTNHGFYKYINDDLYKFKMHFEKDSTSIKKKYINDIDFKITNNKWIKIDKEYSLPRDNAIIKSNMYIFSPRPKSKTKFIVEKINGGIHDYYFTSNEDFDNHSLKEDITSFLLLLM